MRDCIVLSCPAKLLCTLQSVFLLDHIALLQAKALSCEANGGEEESLGDQPFTQPFRS